MADFDNLPRFSLQQSFSARIVQEEEHDRLTHEALADVDAGRVFDHKTVQAWAESLKNG